MSQTHTLTSKDGNLIKRYTSWDRDEHRREWTVLNHLHAHVPGLVPVPLGADLDADPPSVTMSRITGAPLDGPLSPAQLDGLKLALDRMWSVPAAGLPPRRYHPREAMAVARSSFVGADRPGGL